VAPGGLLESAAELLVARQELPAGGGQTHAAPRTAAGSAFDKFEIGCPFQLLQVAPRVTVGHAELGRRLPKRSMLVDRSEEVRPAAAELQALAEHHPNS